jgi:hypothetical protein
MQPDTVPGDTVPADTVPPPPPPTLPAMPAAGETGWAVGVWEWDRTGLLRLPDVSLLQLLERIPGVVPVRATTLGQPEGASIFGATAGAVRYEIDGFALDPLVGPTFDPSRMPLVALSSVRVERTVTGATVRIATLAPTDARSESIIEAGTGDYRTNLFRGTFMAPRVLGGSLALGFESLGTQMLAAGSTNQLGGWVKWTWAGEDSGMQVEYRQSDVTRSGVGPPLDGGRRDWVVRARSRLGPVTGEAYAGASNVEDELGGVSYAEGASQGGLRLASRLDGPVRVEATAALRLRGHPRLPAQELEAAAWAYPTRWVALGIDARHGRWDVGDPTGSLAAQVRVGSLLGITATAGVFRTEDQPPLVADPIADDPGMPADRWIRDGLRFGGQFQRWGLLLAGAAVQARAELVPGFGLPFDEEAPDLPGGDANGFEAIAHIPTGWHPLRLEGWYVGMDVPEGWPYFPSEQWTAALVYHHLPLPSGNLELYGRAEHTVRGAMTVPQPDGFVSVGAYRATNLEITIRVLTVRAFIRWNNLMNRPFQEDLPGFQRLGQHILYGVKWEFWN